MSRILCVTRSLAQHLQTGAWDPRLPSSFEITPERLARAKAVPKMTDDLDGRAVGESVGEAAEVGGLGDGVASVKL